MPRGKPLRARSTLLLGAFCSLGCSGSQSALAPAGRQAERLANLFWGLTIGTAIVWLVVVGLALYATYFARAPLSWKGGRKLIIGGGIALPSVVLAGLLSYSLAMLPDLLAAAPAGALTVRVTGHQWWWRVQYTLAEQTVELANEIHLPVGRPVEFQLQSTDVIHSFWIPSLGGKVDMIPGRSTRLLLEPTRVGTYRGVCAEYCGTSHAIMSFVVVVEPEPDFERWLATQAQPAAEVEGGELRVGAQAFASHGCGACHAVRGTSAGGEIGPDLTHVGGRQSIAAGLSPVSAATLASFIARPSALKPGVHMPTFGMLPAEDIRLIGLYLEGLK